MFQGDNRFGYESPPCDLKKTINDLKKIREGYEKNHEKSTEYDELVTKDSVESGSNVTDSFTSFKSLEPSNKVVRDSIEMLQNGGKFTKIISDDKNSNSPQKIAKEDVKAICASISSLCDSMTISPVSFETRKSPPQIKLNRNLSRPTRIKKPAKKVAAQTKPKSSHHPKSPLKTAPKIVSTCFAKCRIHQYEDGSHSFEIISPNRDEKHSGDNSTSEIVFVVLANGETALFRSSSSKSISNILSFDSSQ